MLVFIAADGEVIPDLYKIWVWFKVMDPPQIDQPIWLLQNKSPIPPKSMLFGRHPVASRSHSFEPQANLLLQKFWELLKISRAAQRLLIQFHCDFAWTTAIQEEKEPGHWYFLGQFFCHEIVPRMRWHYCSALYGRERCELWRLKSKEWDMSKSMRGTWNLNRFHIFHIYT